MIELNKDPLYYTPNIEDIFIGYECEINPSAAYSNEWCPYIFQVRYEDGCYRNVGNTFDMLEDGCSAIRTKHLTKDQIESEGWKEDNSEVERGRYSEETFSYYYRKNIKGGFVDLLQFTRCPGVWNIRRYLIGEDQLYTGPIPSINELRYISKLLGI